MCQRSFGSISQKLSLPNKNVDPVLIKFATKYRFLHGGRKEEGVLAKSKTEAFLINFVEVLRDEGDLHTADFRGENKHITLFSVFTTKESLF